MNETCSIHGKPLIRLGGQMQCVGCLARSTERAIEVRDQFEERRRLTLLEGRLHACGIPPEFVGATFDRMRLPQGDAAQVERARRIIETLQGYSVNFAQMRRKRPGFLVTGDPGTGKTHLACALVASIILSGFSARYVSMPSLTSALRAAMRNPGGVQHLVEDLVAVDFLVIDEIDLHGTSDNDYNCLYEIVNGRYELGGHPTMAISNRDVAHLRADLDERVISRLLGSAREISMVWPSFRSIPQGGRANGAGAGQTGGRHG